MHKRKPILCLDFDGVVHSYTSGWQGITVIPDPPIPGAFEFISQAMLHFKVAIFSSRSTWRGRRAMRRWLLKHLQAYSSYSSSPEWWRSWVAQKAFADPWQYEQALAAKRFVKSILWPRSKPLALLTLDGRAVTFTGTFPTILSLQQFGHHLQEKGNIFGP